MTKRKIDFNIQNYSYLTLIKFQSVINQIKSIFAYQGDTAVTSELMCISVIDGGCYEHVEYSKVTTNLKKQGLKCLKNGTELNSLEVPPDEKKSVDMVKLESFTIFARC